MQIMIGRASAAARARPGCLARLAVLATTRRLPVFQVGGGAASVPRCLLWLVVLLLLLAAGRSYAREGVVLLHGLGRSASSMAQMKRHLEREDYVVLNIAYPSTQATVEPLADQAISGALTNAVMRDCSRIHFVTHSLGGILVRSYFSRHMDARLGRVVMLGPPNQGSEVVDKLGAWWLFKRITGPAGGELGTSLRSTPNQLGAVTFELGVIAGDRSLNRINSLMIRGPDDGKVSVERTKVRGMKEHLVVHVTHPYLMKRAQVMEPTVRFLKTGSFQAANRPGDPGK